MVWREVSVIDRREELARLALAPGTNRQELCRRFGISRSNGYKWLRRFLVEGRGGGRGGEAIAGVAEGR